MAAVASMASFTMTAAPAAAAQTFPWHTQPGVQAVVAGSAPAIVVAGDSLVVLASPTLMGNAVKSAAGGRGVLVEAAPGATWVTYGKPGQQNNNSLLWNLADYVDARLTIVALATNDARILTQYPLNYNIGRQYEIMRDAVYATRQHSQCVLLVNMRPQHLPGMSGTFATAVNNNIKNLAENNTVGGIYLANWAAHSQASWYVPGDVHLTSQGSQAYRTFIASMANYVIEHNNC